MKKYLRLKENIILIDNYLYPRAIKVNGMEGLVYPINSTGVLMLALCNGTNTIEDIVENIAKKYGVSEQMVMGDAIPFFNDKVQLGIVEVTDCCEAREVNFRGRDNIILPYQLSVETTNQCQLKCKHCYNQSGAPRENELTTAEIIEVLKQYEELGGISVMLTGGEIFLKENVTDLIDYAANHFLRVVILSNAFYISEKVFQKLEEYKDSLAMQISIDGMQENHDFIRGIPGAYQRTIENVKRLVDMGLTVSISCTLNERNFNDIYELARTVKEMGCASINIGAVAAIGRATESKIASVDVVNSLSATVQKVRQAYGDDTFVVGENIEEYSDKTETVEGVALANKCGAGYKILHLFADGKIGICPSHGGIVDKFYVNDVRKAPLAEILSFDNMRYLLDIPTPSKEQCGDCAQYDECAQCIVTMLSKPAEGCALKRKLIDEKIIDMQE